MIHPLTATQTLDRARTAMQSGKGAGLPELLKIIETVSANVGEVTIQELAELIEKDAAVLARIVQIANTIVHNPSFTPLSSLTHAIHQIGFSRVRSLTLSIMLIENAGTRNPPEQREAAAQALCAGLIAQGCAAKLGTIDPETAFAAAALRNFGYIILPAVSLEHYQEAMLRLKEKPEDIAFRGMFGLTPLDLSRRLLANARLPEDFAKALRDLSPEAMAGTATLQETRLLAVADFGTRIARAALDANKGSDRFGEETREIARRFRRVLPDALDAIPDALQHADQRLSGFLRTDGIRALPTASLNRIRARVQHAAPDTVAITPPPAEGPAILVTASAADAAVAQQATEIAAPVASAGEPNRDTLAPTHESAPELVPVAEPPPSAPPFETTAMEEETAPVPADPWRAALDLVRDSFGAQECWHFTTQVGSPMLTLSHGAGERWSRFQRIAFVRSDERSVFGVCHTRREAVVIHNLTDPKLRPYLPEWMSADATAPQSFVLLPISEGKRALGLVLIGWHAQRQIVLNKAQLELARQTLDHAYALRASAAA